MAEPYLHIRVRVPWRDHLDMRTEADVQAYLAQRGILFGERQGTLTHTVDDAGCSDIFTQVVYAPEEPPHA